MEDSSVGEEEQEEAVRRLIHVWVSQVMAELVERLAASEDGRSSSPTSVMAHPLR